jgi:hypothetical protein
VTTLAGHNRTATTELVYRHEPRPRHYYGRRGNGSDLEPARLTDVPGSHSNPGAKAICWSRFLDANHFFACFKSLDVA